MISRAQGKTWTAGVAAGKQQKLSALEKAMLKWAVVDPEDRLLDASISSGMMAEYLRRNMQCEVCGVSDNMENVRAARSRLQNCDIVYSPAGDIPWREDSFDTILMRVSTEEPEQLSRMFAEAHRVLKPGGQLILGAPCYPAWINAVLNWFAAEEKQLLNRCCLERLLRQEKLNNVSWQRTGIGLGVMIAWKPKPSVLEVLEDTME